MAKRGPQSYPGASRRYWFQDNYGGDPMEVNAVVLHTTEGRSVPTYGGGGSAPNLTAAPDFAAQKLDWFQHFDIETSARALVNLPGGVETNTCNVTQVELVGTCDPATHAKWVKAGYKHIYWPEAPDWALREVAQFLAWMHNEHGVPLAGPEDWPAYPKSYGATSARMTGKEWNSFRGVCGHQHVPENTHGDPGAIDFPKLLGYAKGYATAPGSGPTSPTTGQPAAPKVDVSHVVAAARKDPAAPQGHATYKAEVLTVERALKAEGLLAAAWVDGSFGTKTKDAYAAWQRSSAGGSYRGADADGIPGKSSLSRLAKRHGFKVVD